MSAWPWFPVLWLVLLSTICFKQGCSVCTNGCLYFTNPVSYHTSQSVHRLALDTLDTHQTGLTGVNLLGLAYDVTADAIYVTDVGAPMITDGKFIVKFQDQATTKVKFPSTVALGTVAVDPFSGLVYYSDMTKHVIGVYTSDLHYHHLVVPQGTSYPHSMTLDPGNATMYWVDSTEEDNWQIRKASMDGKGIQTIVSRNLQSAYGLTLVVKDQRLYWCSKPRHVIESVSTDGSDRQVVHRLSSTSECLGMTADDDYIYWMQADNKTRTTMWKLLRNGTGLPDLLYSRRYILQDSISPRGMALSTVNYVNGTNQCSGSSRGGCAHICIPTTQSRVCRCSVEYILQPDGTSCQKLDPKTGLMVVDGGAMEVFVFDLVEHASHPLNVTGRKWSPHGHVSPTAVAYDDLHDLVFWVDSALKTITSTCFPNKPNCHVIHRYGDSQSSELVDIALDKTKQHVYVVDQALQYILRRPYGGGTEKKMRIVPVHELLTSIALDTNKRVLYWTISGTQSRIEKVSMDSDKPLKLYEKFIALPNRPQGLSIDMNDKKLYWTSEESGLIMSVNLDGSNQRTIIDQHVVSAMTVGGGCLFWAYQGSKDIHAMNVNTSLVRRYRSAEFRHIIDLEYFSEEQANVICNGNGSVLPPLIVGKVDGPVVSLTIIICSAAAGALVLLVLLLVGVCIWRKRRRHKPYNGEVINGPMDMELEPIHTPPPIPGAARPPALRPPEAMIGRPLPQAPGPAEDPRSPQPDGPAEAGFRQFLLRAMSTTAPEYQGLLAESQREDGGSYSPLNTKRV